MIILWHLVYNILHLNSNQIFRHQLFMTWCGKIEVTPIFIILRSKSVIEKMFGNSFFTLYSTISHEVAEVSSHRCEPVELWTTTFPATTWRQWDLDRIESGNSEKGSTVAALRLVMLYICFPQVYTCGYLLSPLRGLGEHKIYHWVYLQSWLWGRKHENLITFPWHQKSLNF